MLWEDEPQVNVSTASSFAQAIVTSTVCASSVFLSSYRNMIFNQSAHVFS